MCEMFSLFDGWGEVSCRQVVKMRQFTSYVGCKVFPSERPHKMTQDLGNSMTLTARVKVPSELPEGQSKHKTLHNYYDSEHKSIQSVIRSRLMCVWWMNYGQLENFLLLFSKFC